VAQIRLREGARYRCFGDGLCCTDIHAIGPLTRPEIKRLAIIEPRMTTFNPRIEGVVITPRNGGCAHLTEVGCRVHQALGLHGKPSVCRRFPYRLVSTPVGRRVSTEHRCPCRTLGDRPTIDLADALESMRTASGRLVADLIVPDSPDLRAYLAAEPEILRDPIAAIDVEPFPPLEDVTWIDVAHHYRGKLDGSACGDALAWFGDLVLSLHGHDLRHLRARPWKAAFDRAEARTATVVSAESILADWIADELWGLEWTERGTFEHARRDLATRLAVAREFIRRMPELRADRAAAEAVLIGEMAGAAPLFASVVRAFREEAVSIRHP
jgi:hypothetical protein